MERLGRYVLLERVGKGGMGLVWRAYDPMADRLVVIKTIGTSDVGAKARFGREARLLAQLEHPNIVRVFEFAEDDGVPYIVMELVVGTPLSAILPRVPNGIDRSIALRIVNDLCRGLSHVHAAGVVHRDVSAQNVMVTVDGEVKLLDFGIAKAPDGEMLTLPGRMVGKPGYMAPEQIVGGTVDTRSDVYATGVLLYEMCTGRRPFGKARGRLAEVSRAVVKGEFMAPVHLGVPEELSAAICAAMAVAPDDRPKDGRALIEVLENLGAVDKTSVDVAAAIRAIDPVFASDALQEESRLRQVVRTRTMPVAGLGNRGPGARTSRLAMVALVFGAILLSFAAGWFGRGVETLATPQEEVDEVVPRSPTVRVAPAEIGSLAKPGDAPPVDDASGVTNRPAPSARADASDETANAPRKRRSSPKPVNPSRPATTSAAAEAFESGRRSLALGELTAARKAFERCLELDAKYARCLRSLGLVFDRKGDARSAANVYRRYLEVVPDAPDRDQILARITRTERPLQWRSAYRRHMKDNAYDAALTVVGQAGRSLPMPYSRQVKECVETEALFGPSASSAENCARLLRNLESAAAEQAVQR